MHLLPIAGLMAFGFLSMGLGTVGPALSTDETAVEITCAALAADGPGDNAYVTVTGMGLVESARVRASGGGGALWIPGVPVGSRSAVASSRVLVKLGNVDRHIRDRTLRDLGGAKLEQLRGKTFAELWQQTVDDLEGKTVAELRGAELYERWHATIDELWATQIETALADANPLFAETRWTGVVLPAAGELSFDDREAIRAACPGIDLDRCWILDEGRQPRNGFASLAMIVVGAGLALFVLVGLARLMLSAAAPPDTTAAA